MIGNQVVYVYEVCQISQTLAENFCIIRKGSGSVHPLKQKSVLYGFSLNDSNHTKQRNVICTV